MRLGIALLVVSYFASMAAHAGDLVIYDDATENGFNQDCSFNASPNFANGNPTHNGSDSISFDAAQFGAVSWCTPSSLSTTDYSGITFWVNGGASGGQNLELVVGLAGTSVVQASLDTLLGTPIPANTWVQVTASFDSAPMQYSGNFDQISIQDNSGNAPAAPQPTVYFDDVSLTGRSSVVDEIFKNGFEGSAANSTAPIVIEQNVTACSGNLAAERYTWQDSGGWTRSATLSHNDTNTNGAHEGELCDFTYHTDAVTVRDVQELTAGGAGGFGYVVSHLIYQSAAYDAALAGPDHDDSPLGHGYKGTFTRLLNGRHHAILRFQLNYPRVGENPTTHVTTRYLVPVTIDWLIATGRDHPLWSVTFNLQGAASDDGLGHHPVDGEIVADSRAPYGDMAFDGAGTAAVYGNNVGGVAWGDHYKFTTTGATPMTLNSSWTWNQANTIPYVYLWTQAPSPDAEMGIVQSEDIAKQDAGSEFSSDKWAKTSASANAGCSDGTLMPCVDFEWAYQANADDADTTPEGDKHLTWGTGYGFLGMTGYPTDGYVTTSGVGYPRQNYATYVVLGLHSANVTSAEVTQVENAMASTLTANPGSVLTSGHAGVNDTTSRAFLPHGYDRVYGTWDVDVGASANDATMILNASGNLLNPIFVLHHHSAALPGTVLLDGLALTADVDYFATVDTSDATDTRLWITVNRTWTGSRTLTVQ